MKPIPMKPIRTMKKLAAVVFCALASVPLPAQKTYRDATSGFLNETSFVPAAAYAAGAAATPVDLGAYASGVIVVNVTAMSGTAPSLTVNFQACATYPGLSSPPPAANCATHTSSAAITAAGIYLVKVDHFARWNTVNYAIAGANPSFTFSVVGYFKPTS